MTININGFDYDKLNEMIDAFKQEHDYQPILIMSKQTADRMFDDFNYTPLPYGFSGICRCSLDISDYVIGTYNGNKVYVDNEFKFGSVEIR